MSAPANRRDVVSNGLALLALAGAPFSLSACISSRRDESFDAVVVRGRNDEALARGAPAFNSVQAAIAQAPADGIRPFRILVTRGRWHEKLVVDKPFVHLVGEDRDGSVLTHDTAAGQRRPDGEPWGTWGCASLIVRAPHFAARNLSIENAFDYAGHLRAPKLAAIGPNGAQAVALMLDAGSDRALVQDVSLLGHQDTLFVEAGRSLFRNCFIAGSVDFAFGAGEARFDACELHSRYREGKPQQGYVAAPSTLATQQFGLVFLQCRLTREAAIPAHSVALGRPWRPTKQFADGRYGDPQVVGAAAFLRCWMDDHIAREGWDEMSYTARTGERVAFDPLQARLFEFENEGPGAGTHPRRRLLTREQAAPYRRITAAASA